MSGKPFSEFNELSQDTKDILQSLGFERATPVQEATIPLFVGNKDVAVDACTGSGKTLAFIIPVIEKMRKLDHPLKRHQIGAIIISPTRELSRQIHSVAQPFINSLPWVKSALLVGGTDPHLDIALLKDQGGHVLIGTPGRIDDILQRCLFFNLKSVEILILDEADRLLDMGFKAQVDSIMKKLPKQRRTGLFSATQTEAVEALARAGLRNPVRVNVAVALNSNYMHASKNSYIDHHLLSNNNNNNEEEEEEGDDIDDVINQRKEEKKFLAQHQQITPSTLSVYYTVLETTEKLPQLIAFLNNHSHEKVIVYFLTCACVDYFAKILPFFLNTHTAENTATTNSTINNTTNTTNGGGGTRSTSSNTSMVHLHALHGRMKQSARESTLHAFTTSQCGVLLATDIAARGLDIPDVHWIVQHDAPQDPSAFVHRCGRTARMGRSGAALIYITPHELAYVEFLSLRKIPMMEKKGEEEEEDDEKEAEGQKKGDRKKKKDKRSDSTGHGDAIRSRGNGVVLSAESVLRTLRTASESDRAVMEAGTKAFVSYIRAYKEHHCKFIFRVEELPMGYLASSFALLRLPRMQELKKAGRALASGLGLEGFEPSTMDIESIKFKDKAREKQRKAVLKQRAAAEKEEEEEERQRKSEKNEKIAQQRQMQLQQQQRLTASKRRQLEARQEMHDLNEDYALLRKLKKGKMSVTEYDKATGVLSSSEDEDEDKKKKKKKQETRAAQLIADALIKKAKKKKKKVRRKAAKME